MNKQLSKNIKNLRKSYGETQLELGLFLNYGDGSAINKIEKGNLDLKEDDLQRISFHYGVPIYALLNDDIHVMPFNKVVYTIKDAISIEEDILPNMITEKSYENKHFKCAMKYHEEIINCAIKGEKMNDTLADTMMEEIYLAIDEESIEAFLLLVRIIFGVAICICDEQKFKMVTALSEGKGEDKEFAKKYMLSYGEKSKSSNQDKDEIIDNFLNLIKVMKYEIDEEDIKLSEEFNQIADFYLALTYIAGIVDNDIPNESNTYFGIDLMKTFAVLGNKYAKNYFATIRKYYNTKN